MTITEPITTPEALSDGVLDRLRELCVERGLDALAANLTVLQDVVVDDLGRLEVELDGLGKGRRIAHQAARRLVRSSGKRLRPVCVALASRMGKGFDDRALDLAVAVELVHNATLLHDDVIDLAPTRRGRPAARVELGNAASIFAGDWLLIEALRRVQRADVDGLLEELLETVAEMIRGESLQLENRGNLDVGVDLYLEIAESKSATLFRWALLAGGRAGGLSDSYCQALADYGTHLGIAFQVIDDLLDLTGDRGSTGKALFTDLREGKMTLPLILALERDDSLRRTLSEALGGSGAPDQRPWRSRSKDAPARSRKASGSPMDRRAEQVDPWPELDQGVRERVLDALIATGAEQDSRAQVLQRIEAAQKSLEALPASEAKSALKVIADSTGRRSR